MGDRISKELRLRVAAVANMGTDKYSEICSEWVETFIPAHYSMSPAPQELTSLPESTNEDRIIPDEVSHGSSGAPRRVRETGDLALDGERSFGNESSEDECSPTNQVSSNLGRKSHCK